ncbi:hypothetical protein ACLOJK_028160 [Asimina triloba]
MSAGICGKRLGFEEIFGSSAPAPSSKRLRCSGFGSPIRSSDFTFGSEDKVCILLRMFPAMDRELVETVLNTHGHRIEDAIQSLHSLCLGDASAKDESSGQDSMIVGNSEDNAQTSNQKVEAAHNNNSNTECILPENESSWVDIFVQEMMNASSLDDARGRAMRMLEAFERSVITHSKQSEEQETNSLKEQLEALLRDNQILKRAVAIQHERNLEQEEKLKEVQQLKHMISQYQEQIRSLELSNYTLKLHLQRAQESSSIPNHFHPDVF